MNPVAIFSRLDFFLVNCGLVSSIEECEIIPGFRSDHAAVLLELNIEPIRKGPGLRKLNVSHLEDKEFIQGISQVTDQELNTLKLVKDLALILESLKIKMIQFSQDCSVSVARKKNQTFNALQDRLNLVMEEIQNSNSPTQTKFLKQEFTEIKSSIEVFLHDKAKGA